MGAGSISQNTTRNKSLVSMKTETLNIESLIPYAKNSRTHSAEQVAQIASSIREFGWTNPVLIDGQGTIIAGHGRVMAARALNTYQFSALKAVGGRIAQSLKTTARSVVSSNVAKFAGLSMLTAASSGAALAEQMTLRDTIGTPDVTKNSVAVDSIQNPSPRPSGITAAPYPAKATFCVDIPPNSTCKLKDISFVFACKSSVATPGMDLYDFRQLFNGASKLMVRIFDGPVGNLANNYVGEIHNEEISREAFQSVMPWTTSTNNPYSLTKSLPLYLGNISLENAPVIETGAAGKRIFIKVQSDKLVTRATELLMLHAKGDKSTQDVLSGVNGSGYITESMNPVESTAFASKVTADVTQKVVLPPLVCELKQIGDSKAVCWDTVFGKNYTVQMRESFTTGEWLNLTNVTVNTTEDGKKNFVIIPANSSSAYFRLAQD
jgi:ParB-like nuclease domain